MPGVEITPLFGEPGTFRVYVRPPGNRQIDVTFFRDKPTQINSWSTADPFGDATAELSFPAVTVLDRPGTGDLWWMLPWADVDIVHYNSDFKESGWRWEGFFVSESISDEGVGYQAKGALYMADNYLAKPTYPSETIPYELLIQGAFDPDRYNLRCAALVTEWPKNWGVKASPSQIDNTPDYLRPYGLKPGQNWTGLAQRATGGWDPMLTGFVQGLLGMMYTKDGGQWTIIKRNGRIPVLHVREPLRAPLADTLVIYVGGHGIECSFTRDFTQSANVIFGEGTDTAGTKFSGMQVARDGSYSYYEPFASLPYVYPSIGNTRYLPDFARKESKLTFPDNMDYIGAQEMAAAQLRKFADPGFVGTITLKSDPLRYDQPFSRFLVSAGMSILVKGLRGGDVLFHVAQSTVNLQEGTTELSVDTKFRDALTIEEVKARTRDALDPKRLLSGGQYSLTIQDLVFPWSYSEGAGVIPLTAKDLFTKTMNRDSRFPWTEWTKKYPPKDNPKYYIKIPKADKTNANNNWSGMYRQGGAGHGVTIRLAQAGNIRLTQIAAYDKLGNVMPVRFHVGIWATSGTTYRDMPALPKDQEKATGYKANQHYPFFKDAWEKYKANGEERGDDVKIYLPASGSTSFKIWGNYYEGAGFSPGLQSSGNGRTGMLIDETRWNFNLVGADGTAFDVHSKEKTAESPTAGLAYVIIYCDEQTEDVFFLGRLFREEPGTA